MRLKRFAFRVPSRVACRLDFRAAAATAVLAFLLVGLGGPAVAAAPGLDNAKCLSCHAAGKAAIAVPGADGESRELHAVPADAFASGAHAKMDCVACHTAISDNAETDNAHRRDPAQKVKDCASCHEELWERAKQQGAAKDKPRLGVVVDNIAAYKESFHARKNADDPTRPNASCDECHSSHSFNVPPKDSPQYAEWRLGVPETCGKSCHEESLETFTESIHGEAIFQKKDAKAAVCSDCHSAHAVGNTSLAPFKLAVTAECGNCHEENFKSYKATYHGQINTLGYAYTAKCFDCHGSHDVLEVKNPDSKVHPDNRMKTCKECHNGKKDLPEAPPGFASYQPHGHSGDFERYPQMWLANQLMVQLLIGTFGFFWLHTLLWFWRELRDRQQGKVRPHVRADAPGLAGDRHAGKHFRRFSATWRAAHLIFALSLMILTLTGLPLFYPDAPWAAPLMKGLGGPQVAGTIHRINAVIFAAVFFWHLAYVALRLARDWKEFRIFGPTSLVPGLQDGKDFLAMLKWFFGKGERPVFDRWTYWEKFDYWAPFWGVTIIGVSGLLMWASTITATFLPGWVFNVAAIFHSEEAFLAVVFLFTVHFFNNHFRPDKFPLEVVMFTGSMSVEEYRREHALEYERLMKSGELEKYIVDAPSRPMALGSKILGFTLIAAGLTLLTLVAIGFFGSH